MTINFKVAISISSYGLNIGLSGFILVLSRLLYEIFWPGLVFLLPLYYLYIKVLMKWEVKVDNHYFYFKRLFSSEFEWSILELEKYEIKKYFWGPKIIILSFKDGSSYKFIGIPQFLLKEYYKASVIDLLDEIIAANRIKS